MDKFEIGCLVAGVIGLAAIVGLELDSYKKTKAHRAWCDEVLRKEMEAAGRRLKAKGWTQA